MQDGTAWLAALRPPRGFALQSLTLRITLTLRYSRGPLLRLPRTPDASLQSLTLLVLRSVASAPDASLQSLTLLRSSRPIGPASGCGQSRALLRAAPAARAERALSDMIATCARRRTPFDSGGLPPASASANLPGGRGRLRPRSIGTSGGRSTRPRQHSLASYAPLFRAGDAGRRLPTWPPPLRPASRGEPQARHGGWSANSSTTMPARTIARRCSC